MVGGNNKQAMMDVLGLRARKEWEAQSHPRLLRTGCHDVWDAIFWSIREYRDASEEQRKKMIKKQTRIDPYKRACADQMKRTQDNIMEDYLREKQARSEEDTDRKIFFSLFPHRLLESELFPYLDEFIEQTEDVVWDRVREELVEKALLLGEYRIQKKKLDVDMKEIAPGIESYLRAQMTSSEHVSYDLIWEACMMMDYHVMIISSEEKLLFDSHTWKDGIPESDFRERIVVLAHADGRYESIGAYSFTKDHHQKISRLFGHDDDFICLLQNNKQ